MFDDHQEALTRQLDAIVSLDVAESDGSALHELILSVDAALVELHQHLIALTAEVALRRQLPVEVSPGSHAGVSTPVPPGT